MQFYLEIHPGVPSDCHYPSSFRLRIDQEAVKRSRLVRPLSIYTHYNHEHGGTVSSHIPASTPPQIKLKHLITINSLNAVIITSWWYCTSYVPCAPFSSADVCHLQPLSFHTLPVIFAFLWGAAAIFIYLFIFSPQIFWLLWVVFSGKRKGEVEKKWNKKIKKRIWTETTALNERNTFEVCLLICSLLHWSLVM